MIWILLVVLLLTIFYFKVIKVYSYWTDRGVKQRKQTYILGDNGGIFLRTESVVDVTLKVYNAFPEDRYTGMYQMMIPTLMVKDPELVKRMTVKDFDHFIDHRAFIPDDIDPLWSRNLIALKGDRWHDMRSTLSPSFTTSKMKMMFALISERAATFVDYLTAMEQDTISLELKDAFTRYANDVIATSAFGIKCNSMKDRENEFYLMGKKATNFNGFWRNFKFIAISVAPKFSAAVGTKFFDRDVGNFFQNTVIETIQTREKNNIVRLDMLHLLMEARKMQNNDEKQQDEIDTGFATVEESKPHMGRKAVAGEITDIDIVAQALIFFFAGFDTVSTAMCLMGHELTAHPDIQKLLQKEIDETYEDCNGELTYDALMKMRYMDMVVSETLRMWPPAPALDRICVKPYTIKPTSGAETPLHLQTGDVISVPVVGFHRDPQYFPNPEVFDPERFSDENKHKIQPYTYMPFGLGPRNCVGSRFALMEAIGTLCAGYTGMYQMLLPTLMVKDPELVKRITVKDFEHFVDHRPFVQDEDDPLWSRILVALKGDRWHAMRSTLSPSFTTSKMKILFSLISESAVTFIDYLASIEEETISMELKDTFTRFTNDAIATSAFGIKCNSMTDRENEFFMMGNKATALNGFFTSLKLMALSAAPKLSSALGIKFLDRDVRNFFIRTVTETIRTREKNNITRPDMLHLLLEARKGKNDGEERHNEVDTGFATVNESKLHRRNATPVELTDLDITAQAMIFFFGGFESISTTMCFMGHELTTHPKIQEKLREEVDETYEDCKGELTYEALMGMRYMDMVVCETLRMWPPGPALDRMCVKPYMIENISGDEKPIHLKIGDVVSIPVVGFHRDPKYFPKPEVFDPERFSDENKHKIQPYTYLPFGSGPRNCIGSRFALMEVKALFFYLLSKFELVAVEKTQIPLKTKPGFRLTAENGFWIGLKTRSGC